MRKLVLPAIAALALAVTGPALANGGGGGGKGGHDDGSTAFGGATVTKHGAILVANTGNTSTTDDFSGVTVPVPTGLTFGQITDLSTQFNVTDDDCGAGSPRFQVRVGGKNVFVALGPAGTLTGCAKNTWLSSGDLTEAAVAECRVDTSQSTGGKQCSSWAEAATLLGSQAVQGVSLVVDASWTGSTNPAFADKEQTVLVRHVTLNGKTYFSAKRKHHDWKSKTNPARLCKAQLAEMGSKSAFNELWAVNGRSNGFGKCVSAVSKARKGGATHEQILAAIASCKAKGLKGSALGACVASRDGVAATLTERQERKHHWKSRKG